MQNHSNHVSPMSAQLVHISADFRQENKAAGSPIVYEISCGSVFCVGDSLHFCADPSTGFRLLCIFDHLEEKVGKGRRGGEGQEDRRAVGSRKPSTYATMTTSR